MRRDISVLPLGLLSVRLKFKIGAEGGPFVLLGFSLLSQKPQGIALFTSAFSAPFALSAFCCALVVTGTHTFILSNIKTEQYDRLMRAVGVSGKVFVPLLSSFACAVS